MADSSFNDLCYNEQVFLYLLRISQSDVKTKTGSFRTRKGMKKVGG